MSKIMHLGKLDGMVLLVTDSPMLNAPLWLPYKTCQSLTLLGLTSKYIHNVPVGRNVPSNFELPSCNREPREGVKKKHQIFDRGPTKRIGGYIP